MAKAKPEQRSVITVVGQVDPYALLSAQLRLLGTQTAEARERALALKRERASKAQQAA